MWRDIETGTVVQRHDEIRELRPLKTLPAILSDEVIAEEGFETVQLVNPQFNQLTQRVDGEASVEQVDGQWTQVWNIIDLPVEEATSARQDAEGKAWEAIKELRSAHQSGGVKIGEKWYQTDESSRIQYISLMMMGANMPTNIQWKTMDNTFITMTPELVSQIFQAIAVQDQAIFATAEQRKAEMMASDNPSRFDFRIDWPNTLLVPRVSPAPNQPDKPAE